MPVTILDKYLENFKQLLIVISGISGSNKSDIADEISKTIKCPHINQNNYLNKDFEEVIEINNKKIKIWDSDDAIDWIEFNKVVNETLLEHKIIIVSGVSFNKDKIDFTPDYHIHLKLSKQILLEKRHQYIEKHIEDYPDMKNIDELTEKQIINQITFPYYLKTTENAIINKFLNINELQINDIVKEVFKLVVYFIENKLYSKRKDLVWNEDTKTYELI